jgi:hypothetical protein
MHFEMVPNWIQNLRHLLDWLAEVSFQVLVIAVQIVIFSYISYEYFVLNIHYNQFIQNN